MYHEVYLGDNYLTLDFENTNLSKGTALNSGNRMVLGVWRFRGESKIIYGGEFCYGKLMQDIAEADFIVAHNAKHELQWLQRMGVDTTSVEVFDTLLAEFVLLGNTRKPLDLGSVCKRYNLPTKNAFVDIMMKGGVCPSVMPRSMLAGRCALDVFVTEKLFLLQRELLVKREMLKVLYTRCWLTPALSDIEFNGMHLDAARVEKEFVKESQLMAVLERDLATLTGGINPRSPQQVGNYLYDVLGFDEPVNHRGQVIRTAADGRATDTATILALKPTTHEQEEFLRLKTEHAGCAARLSKTLEFCMGVCEEYDSIFYGQFNQSVARTHRLSSSGRPLQFKRHKKSKSVQFQNFPRMYKGLFSPRNEGWLLGECDGAQLEFRVAAYLGKDRVAFDDIVNSVDIHSFTAATLTAAGQETDRQGAKEHTFKPLYGGESGTEAEVAYYDAFKARYKGIAATQMRWKYDVLGSGTMTTEYGLQYHWPGTKQTAKGYITNSTAICNYPVQGFATGEIIPIAVGYLWRDMKRHGMQSFLVNTVHDSVIAEIHPDEVELFTELAVKAFTQDVYTYLNDVYDIQFFVPLGTGVKLGPFWGEGEEVKYEPECPYEFEDGV